MILSSDIKKDLLNFLKDNVTAVLATCLDKEPHAATIFYDVDENFNLYFLTKRNTQNNIQAGINKKVFLVVGTGPKLTTAQIKGEASVLAGEERSEAVHRMIVRYSKKGIAALPIQSIQELNHERLVAYKVTPTEVSFMNLNSHKYRKSIADSYHRFSLNKTKS